MCEQSVERAASNLPQSTSSALFTISGGRVLLVALLGEVTTAIQNQTNQTKLVFNSAGVGADRDLCTTGDIANADVGTMLYVSDSSTLSESLKVVADYAKPVFSVQPVLPAGDIELNCAASNTGQAKWVLLYKPLDPGAKVQAA